jgi:hypothetical protein
VKVIAFICAVPIVAWLLMLLIGFVHSFASAVGTVSFVECIPFGVVWCVVTSILLGSERLGLGAGPGPVAPVDSRLEKRLGVKK